MALSLHEATDVADGALEKAREFDIKVSVAVCDAGGRLIVFKRMDGAIWAGGFGSQGKAMTSAAWERESSEVQGRADTPVVRGILAAEGGHMIPSQGGVPIIRNGLIDGACGVGGGTGEQDEECARAGVMRVLEPEPPAP